VEELRGRSRTGGVSTSTDEAGDNGTSIDAGSPRAPADQEGPTRCRATVLSGRGRKARPFRHVCHARDGGAAWFMVRLQSLWSECDSGQPPRGFRPRRDRYDGLDTVDRYKCARA